MLAAAMLIALCACGSTSQPEAVDNTLTVDVYNTGERFLPFFAYVKEQYPEIELSINAFKGANGSEYSTNELEHGNQADIYFTSRNECKDEACRENLIDLSGYEFVNNLSQSILDTISMDGEYICSLSRIQFTAYHTIKLFLKKWVQSFPKILTIWQP